MKSRYSKQPSVFSKKSKAASWVYVDKPDEAAAAEKKEEVEPPVEDIPVEVKNPTEKVEEEAEVADKVDDLPAVDADEKLTSVSQIKPSASQISKMTGRTYISSLQKQLEEERSARERLEGELQELKKVSEEITSQLS